MIGGRPPDDGTRSAPERQIDARADRQHDLSVAREEGDQGRKSRDGHAVLEHLAVQAVLDRDSTRADLCGRVKTKSGVRGRQTRVSLKCQLKQKSEVRPKTKS